MGCRWWGGWGWGRTEEERRRKWSPEDWAGHKRTATIWEWILLGTWIGSENLGMNQAKVVRFGTRQFNPRPTLDYPDNLAEIKCAIEQSQPFESFHLASSLIDSCSLGSLLGPCLGPWFLAYPTSLAAIYPFWWRNHIALCGRLWGVLGNRMEEEEQTTNICDDHKRRFFTEVVLFTFPFFYSTLAGKFAWPWKFCQEKKNWSIRLQ